MDNSKKDIYRKGNEMDSKHTTGTKDAERVAWTLAQTAARLNAPADTVTVDNDEIDVKVAPGITFQLWLDPAIDAALFLINNERVTQYDYWGSGSYEAPRDFIRAVNAIYPH